MDEPDRLQQTRRTINLFTETPPGGQIAAVDSEKCRDIVAILRLAKPIPLSIVWLKFIGELQCKGQARFVPNQVFTLGWSIRRLDGTLETRIVILLVSRPRFTLRPLHQCVGTCTLFCLRAIGTLSVPLMA